MKLLIFGGSFNPVHNGHLHACRALTELIRPDRTLIVPTCLPVHKTVGKDFLPSEHRLAMCRLAFSGMHAQVSDLETAQGKPCYTFDTLSRIREIYPQAELFLACGTDMFLTFDRWYRYRDIYRMATVCAVARDGKLPEMQAFAAEQSRLGMRCLLSQAEPLAVSSTEIRERIRRGDPVSDLVPPSVEEYIRRNGLYR